MVAWESFGQDGSSYGVFARRFSSAGAPLAGELQANITTADDQQRPMVAAEADGDFVVAWRSDLQDGSVDGVFARRFSSAGAPLGGEFQVNAYTTGRPGSARGRGRRRRPTSSSPGTARQDGSAYGVFAQRFVATAPLDIDGNGAADP